MKMRNFRMGLIQTPEQLRFSYQAILEGARRLLGDAVATTSKQVEASLTSKPATHMLNTLSPQSVESAIRPALHRETSVDLSPTDTSIDIADKRDDEIPDANVQS